MDVLAMSKWMSDRAVCAAIVAVVGTSILPMLSIRCGVGPEIRLGWLRTLGSFGFERISREEMK